MDVFSKEKRSWIMSRIKGTNTSTEIVLRKGLFKKGYRYSLKYYFREVRCKPDLTFVSKKSCVFIDGCFWHKCPKCFKRPKSRRRYWDNKIKENVVRDEKQNLYLKKKGWKIIRVWEHEVLKNPEKTIEKVIKRLK